MAHRMRSKTVDSSDSKKTKAATPRRLTEKIAIIRKREHEQSAEFEQAMQSIFEMQQARIHSGGGSMPSLQAIDSTPPAPTIDMQAKDEVYTVIYATKVQSSESIFRDFDEMKRGSGTLVEHTPPQNRRTGTGFGKSSSMETEPYITVGLSNSDHYWNASPEWIEGDLARHKSDSDLQQSLMMQGSPQHITPLTPPQLHRPLKLGVNNDLAMWNSGNKKRPNSATTHALLSPDQYISAPDRLTPPPMGGGSVGTASSLPDLTTIEFSSGLDVPLERDDPPIQEPYSNPFPPQIASFNLLPNNRPGGPCLSPTSRAAGPSKLVYNSFQAPNSNFTTPPNSAFTPNTGFQYPHISPPVTGYRQPQPTSVSGGGISRSPTMPEFRNMNHSTNGFVARFRPPPPAPPHYKPILPSLPHNQSFPPLAGLPGFIPQVGVIQGSTTVSTPSTPPMTIIIQPPPQVTNTPTSLHQQHPVSNNFQQDSPVVQEPALPPSFNIPPPLSPDKSLSSANQFLNGVSPHKPPSSNAPPGLCLPSYTEARLQQSLQQKFASINVGRNEAMIRSHSEENLQKIQKEKPEVIQHNPFMGTLANANSVPCVYVESSNADTQYERSDSPTTLDSPSTSASYASSPPSVRPYWIEQDTSLGEYVFKEWPLEGPPGGPPSNRPGSPLAHHKSLTDLSAIPEITELVTSSRSHQLSLPSVAMTDLTVDEQLEKGNSPSDYYLHHNDFEMEEAVMDSLLKNDVPELHPFDISMLSSDHASSLVSEALMSDPFLRTGFN